MLALPFARIGARDDIADSRLIESFVTIVGFQDFEMRPECARVAKLFSLGRVDLLVVEQIIDALAGHSPVFALCESLLQMCKISKGGHGRDAGWWILCSTRTRRKRFNRAPSAARNICPHSLFDLLPGSRNGHSMAQ